MSMQTIFLRLLNMSITAGWLVLAVILLRVLLKKAPKAFRVALWALVGIRLVCPFSFESVLSLVPSAQTVQVESLETGIPEIESGIPALDTVINEAIDAALDAGERVGQKNGDIEEIKETLNETAGANTVNEANAAQEYARWAAIVWIAGMAAMGLYAVVSYGRVYRKVREAVSFHEHIWLCDHIDTPFILGVIRPRIYLPSDMSELDMQYVIAHESAHLKRRDHWWKPLGFLLLTVHWLNPLMWVAYVLFCRDIELACDERVIRDMGAESKKPYSEALINCSVSRKGIAACPLAFGEVGVKGRIKSVLNYRKPRFWVMIGAMAVCVVVAVCFLTDPPGESEDAQSETTLQRELAEYEVYYEYKGSVDPSNPYILLNTAEQTFVFSESAFSSNWRTGNYTILGNSLMLRTAGQDHWHFRLVDGAWVFDASKSSAIPRYNYGEKLGIQSPVPDGAVFEWAGGDAQAISSGGTDGATEETDSDNTPKRYVYRYSVDSVDPYFNLNPEDHTFFFSYCSLSSILNYGEYTVTDDALILQTALGYTYIFHLNEDGNYVFDGENSSPLQKVRYAANESEGMYAITDGVVFELEVDNDELLLAEPPQLMVVNGHESVFAGMGNFEWDYKIDEDQRRSCIACGSMMLEAADDLNTVELKYKDPLSVWLQFGLDPDQITVVCWNLDEENPEREEVEVDGVCSFSLKDGNYVYAITAQWNSYEQFNGTVEYGFKTQGNTTVIPE